MNHKLNLPISNGRSIFTKPFVTTSGRNDNDTYRDKAKILKNCKTDSQILSSYFYFSYEFYKCSLTYGAVNFS